MPIFKRSDLEKQGMTSSQIDFVIAEASRGLAENYILKSEAEEMKNNALNAAKPQQVNVSETEEYKALENELSKVKTLQGEDFNSVKAKYKDMVWSKLDHSEKHKPYSEQLTDIQKEMPDIFLIQEQTNEEAPKPQFGAGTEGSMPKGNESPKFNDYWGFGKDK